jgi:hypothetical protein
MLPEVRISQEDIATILRVRQMIGHNVVSNWYLWQEPIVVGEAGQSV